MRNWRTLLLTGLKAAGSAAVAITIASLLNLQFSATAGIIAILSLMGTKRETLTVALGRLMAYAAALLIAFVCFSLLGDGLLAFGVYLFVFAALCYACSWGYATAMISVLISHFMGTGGMTWAQVGNESLLFLIGTSCGILTNLHLHPDEERLDALLRQADEQMRTALQSLADAADAEKCLCPLGETLRQADECAAKNAGNSLTAAPTREMHYIAMRRQQRRILLQVMQDARKVQGHPPQEAEVRALIRRISAEYDRENDCASLLSALHDLLAEMQRQPLPATRGEFEDRALLYAVLRRMEDFLLLKREFYETADFTKNQPIARKS